MADLTFSYRKRKISGNDICFLFRLAYNSGFLCKFVGVNQTVHTSSPSRAGGERERMDGVVAKHRVDTLCYVTIPEFAPPCYVMSPFFSPLWG